MQTQVLGLSVDSEPCLKAWAESLGGITYPLLSDFYPHGRMAELYGVLRSEGYTERAIFMIDREGILRYVDVHDIDKQPENDQLLRVLAGMDPTIKPAYEAILTEAYSSKEPDGEVVMYCTPWCQDCPHAREYFKINNIPYLEVDISRDRGAAERVRKWTGGEETTPTLKINGQVIISFDQAKIERALGKKR
jgi:glutaredoxin